MTQHVPNSATPSSTPATDITAAPRAVVIYSGGMDSYTVLHQALKEGFEVHALSFHYGQRHSRELDVARSACESLGVSHEIVDIRAIHGLISNSALTNTAHAMPKADYDEDSMTSTVVPNRNMILLSLAIAKAVNIEADVCFYGAHGGDHVLYPDCRPEFVDKMNAVAAIANFSPIEIRAPFLHARKDEILAAGIAMQLDYSQTWTCYEGRELACGECGSCRERLEAFAHHGLSDPLSYVSAKDAGTR